jgi:PhoPQ-activated pathogenicity-related protein
MLAILLSSLLVAPRPPRELYDYLAKPDRTFAYKIVQDSPLRTEIRMTSQTWHGVQWNHTLLIERPAHVRYSHIGILYITGDGPKKGDYLTLSLVTQATGMPVAMLFDIPNQPIEGHREDDLIAYTFEQFLAHPDGSLPLLFPMAKSAIRAMDVVQKVTRKTADPVDRFVVAGASKRGWTTWLVGAADDPRVKGIAPMVIDTLNIPAQVKHEMDSWGFYSDMIKDYTRRGLQEQLTSPRGHALGTIIDPYSYRENLRVPTLIIKGSNDPYWTVDALDLYWTGLREPKWILNVPNAGHTLSDGIMAAASIGAFAQSIAGDFKMPKQTWTFGSTGGKATLDVSSTRPAAQKLLLWAAESDTLDFRDSPYHMVQEADADHPAPSDDLRASCPLPPGKNLAIFGEYRYVVNGKVFSLSTPTKVFPKQ